MTRGANLLDSENVSDADAPCGQDRHKEFVREVQERRPLEAQIHGRARKSIKHEGRSFQFLYGSPRETEMESTALYGQGVCGGR